MSPGGGAVVVFGLGVTGRAVARYLHERGELVVVVDDALAPGAGEWAAGLGVELVERPAAADLERIVAASRLVVPSPGVPSGHAVFAMAAVHGVPVRSEIELGWERLSARSAAGGQPTLVAVTGTNGKTTVTSLAASMLAGSGLTSVAAGNIGLPLVEAAGLEVDVIVAEVSSFQLHFTDRFRPAVSCWLNLAQDHLDWHPDMEHYAGSKARIWAAQAAGDVAVLNADDPVVLAAAAGLPAGVRRVLFSAAGSTDAAFTVARDVVPDRLVGPDGLELVAVAELPRAFPIDVANALAAAATALAAGASVEGCRHALRQFTGLPHRIELVGEGDGVRWYDDSKATTPASVLAALAGVDSAVLIAGGRNKGLDLSVLGTATTVRAVVAIGEAAAEIQAAFDGVAPVVSATSMEAAVSAATRLARPGDAVLLSPGCASFDWYRSYAERGDDFAAEVNAWLNGQDGKRGSPS